MDSSSSPASRTRPSTGWARPPSSRPRPTWTIPRPTSATPKSSRRWTASSSTARSIPARPWPPRSRRRSCSSSPPRWTSTCTSTPPSMRPTSARSAAAKAQGRPVKFTVDAYPGDLFEGQIHQIRMNSTTTQNVVTYPVVIEAPNPDLKLLPGMTANISFQIEAKDDVLRVPAAALRFVPLPAQVRPEDRHYLGGPADRSAPRARRTARPTKRPSRPGIASTASSGSRTATLLRAVPVTLGLIENQFAEVVERRPRRRPGRRHRDGKPVRAEVKPLDLLRPAPDLPADARQEQAALRADGAGRGHRHRRRHDDGVDRPGRRPDGAERIPDPRLQRHRRAARPAARRPASARAR